MPQISKGLISSRRELNLNSIVTNGNENFSLTLLPGSNNKQGNRRRFTMKQAHLPVSAVFLPDQANLTGMKVFPGRSFVKLAYAVLIAGHNDNNPAGQDAKSWFFAGPDLRLGLKFWDGEPICGNYKDAVVVTGGRDNLGIDPALIAAGANGSSRPSGVLNNRAWGTAAPRAHTIHACGLAIHTAGKNGEST
jgi:hypothetical protein